MDDLVVVELPENEKFVEVSEDGEEEYIDEDIPDNSAKQTRWGVSVFKDWLAKKYPTESLEELSEVKLSQRLAVFYQQLKCDQGKDYSRSAHLSIRAAINRHLTSKQIGKHFSIIRDSAFRLANRSLHAKLKKIRESGVCTVHHHSIIKPADIRKCYETGIFGEDTPLSLLRVNWFNISLFFCRRGKKNQRNLTKSSFVIKKVNDIEFVEMAEHEKLKNKPVVKSDEDPRMFSTGTKECPVQYFKKLLSVLNPGEEALFQKPRKHFISDVVWFERSALGINTLASMMKEISAAANLSQIYTNHSIRATSISLLEKAESPSPSRILEVTGHRNEANVLKVFCEKKTLEEITKCSTLPGPIPIVMVAKQPVPIEVPKIVQDQRQDGNNY